LLSTPDVGDSPRIVVAVALALAGGCGARIDADPGNGGAPDARELSPSDDVDARVTPDGAPSGPADAAADNACGVPATQGDLGTLVAAAELREQGDNDNGEYIYSLAATTPASAAAMDPQPDAIYVELWDNYGGFGDAPAAPGTYPIAGDELSYQTCGVCVFVLADVNDDGQANRILMAVSGTVTVLAVSPAAGSAVEVAIEDVTFTEVDDNFEPLASGCTSPIARGELDGTL
jgi:hypothetical protein